MEEVEKDWIVQNKLYEMFKELIMLKRTQRMVEERLLQVLGKSIERRWMHERIKDQYKHERLLNDLTESYLNRKMSIEPMRCEQSINHSVVHELNTRLDGVVHNIHLINEMSLVVDDFKVYKRIASMLNDEYIYQARLVKLITER